MLSQSSKHSYSIEEFAIALQEDELTPIVEPFLHLFEHLQGEAPSSSFAALLANSNVGARTAPGESIDTALKNYIAQHREQSQIDYGRAEIFVCYDRVYFYRNFTKCLIASFFANTHIEVPQRTTRILDLGSGVGTFSLALGAFPKFRELHYVLVDTAAYQLTLAQFLFTGLHFQNVDYCQQAVYSALLKRGLRVSSYWLCGNKDAVDQLSDKDVQLLFRDGLLLIDYRKNLDFFVQRVKLLTPGIRRLELRCKLPKVIANELGDNLINVHLLIASPPH